jgi:hypothetical protein
MRFHRTIGVVGGIAALTLTAAPAAAQAETQTEHYTADFSQSFVGPCDGNPGLITVQGQGVFHWTDTGQTFQLSDHLRGSFSIDPDDPGLETVSGHFVLHHLENVNYDQLKDWRVTDSVRSVGSTEDGRNLPVQTTLTVFYSADGGAEVKVDSVRCGGEIVP